MRASSLSYVARALAISQAPAFSFLRPSLVNRYPILRSGFWVFPTGLSESMNIEKVEVEPHAKYKIPSVQQQSSVIRPSRVLVDLAAGSPLTAEVQSSPSDPQSVMRDEMVAATAVETLKVEVSRGACYPSKYLFNQRID